MGEMLRSPSTWLPIGLAALGLAGVIGYVLVLGVVEHPDERAPARLFQLLMLLQVASIAWFGLRWVPRAPRPAVVILAAQLLCTALPIAAIVVAES